LVQRRPPLVNTSNHVLARIAISLLFGTILGRGWDMSEHSEKVISPLLRVAFSQESNGRLMKKAN
jgi:hypothetical protein